MRNIIEEAYNRIYPYIINTEIIESDYLNNCLGGHKIMFKSESKQITGAFKVRGVLNAMLSMKEQNILPKYIVAYSTGNHAKAISYVAKNLGIKARIYMPECSAEIKMQAVKNYGAELIVTKSRKEAEERSLQDGAREGNFFLPPSDNDLVIHGAATFGYEALIELQSKNELPDAIFGAIGGGGLISGAYLASSIFDKKIEVYAAEPVIANDAARSYKEGKIYAFEESPATIADGVVTLRLSERTFEYVKKLNGIIEIEEEDIMYWTAWLDHILKISIEPTAALPMAAARIWLQKQKSPKKVLVLLSGGNVDEARMKKIWAFDHLKTLPRLQNDELFCLNL